MLTLRPRTSKAGRRGSAFLWSLAALVIAAALSPLVVSCCNALAATTGAGARRLTAVQLGQAALDDLRWGSTSVTRSVPELPQGRLTVTLTPLRGRSVKQAEVLLTWKEGERTARADWTTLLAPHSGEPETP